MHKVRLMVTMRYLILFIVGVYLNIAAAIADPVYNAAGIYVNGQTKAGDVTTVDYANGSGSNNTKAVDHAVYADVAGGLVNSNNGYFANSLSVGLLNDLTSGVRVLVIGDHNTVKGVSSAAVGSHVQATNDFAVALGYSTVAGGYASLAGGEDTKANGIDSIALGNAAQANHNNTFVWSDGTPFISTNAQSFNVYATGGTHFGGGGLWWDNTIVIDTNGVLYSQGSAVLTQSTSIVTNGYYTDVHAVGTIWGGWGSDGNFSATSLGIGSWSGNQYAPTLFAGNDIYISPSVASALVVKQVTGWVGIGTNSPAATLDVAGTAIVRNDLTVLGSLSVTGSIQGAYIDRMENNFNNLVFNYITRSGITDYGMADGYVDNFRSTALVNTNATISTNTTFNAVSNFWQNTTITFDVGSGGSVQYDATLTNAVRTFTANGTFTLSAAVTGNVLVVGGGGGGGGMGGGGGGGGGVLVQSNYVMTAGVYSVVIGGGGAAGSAKNQTTSVNNGTNSTFATLTAYGGGAGASCQESGGNVNGRAGASGGGGAYQTTGNYGSGGAATNGQGNAGGNNCNADVIAGGGGGGAGAVGAAGSTVSEPRQGGAGGAGRLVNVTYTNSYFGGGGGGGSYGSATNLVALGGIGGGGQSGTGVSDQSYAQNGTNGTPNSGGGGGGGISSSTAGYTGGKGGSGIVVVRYPAAGTVTTNSMTIVTTNYICRFVPQNIRGTLWQADGDAAITNVVNTDFKLYVSRDGGTNYNQVTLASADQYLVSAPTNRMFAGVLSVTNQPTGSNIVLKVVTTNKLNRIYGIGWTAGQ